MQAFVQSWFEVSSLHLLLEGKFSGSDDSFFYNHWLILTNHPWQNGAAGQPHHREQAGGSEGGDTSQDQGPYVSKNLKREPAIMAKLNHPIIVSVGDCYCLVLDFYPWRYLPTSVGMMTMMMPTLMLTMKLIAILMSTNKNGGNDGWGRQRVFVLCLLFQIIILPRHKIEVMFAPNHCDDQNSFFLSFQTRSSSWVDIVYLWLASLTGQVVVQLM